MERWDELWRGGYRFCFGDGAFKPSTDTFLLGGFAQVRQGDVAATVNGVPMTCTLDGVLRGILPDDTPVHKGMKAGDIDPRCKVEHCYTASDKALAIGGGVLEAILDLTGAMKDRAGGYSG